MHTLRRAGETALPLVRGRAPTFPAATARFSTVVPPPGKDRLIMFDTTLRDGEQSPG